MPNALDEVDTAGGIDGVFSLEAVLDLSTSKAVVDSEIAPVLDLFLGLSAWMPVYNLHYGHIENLRHKWCDQIDFSQMVAVVVLGEHCWHKESNDPKTAVFPKKRTSMSSTPS